MVSLYALYSPSLVGEANSNNLALPPTSSPPIHPLSSPLSILFPRFPLPLLLPYLKTRGNQRELDRAKAQKKLDAKAGPVKREGTVQSRNESDASALKAKLERKAAEAAAKAAAEGGGGGGGGGGGKK